MAKGISIHIGLNHVDPKHYQGWDGALNACIAHAKDMRALAIKKGFTGNTLLTEGQATAAAVTAVIQDAAKKLSKGDMLFLTYSGHGGQVRDTNSDEKDNDRMDETWGCTTGSWSTTSCIIFGPSSKSACASSCYPIAATAAR